MKTPEKRSMAFMNCPWKSTAGCNYICEECFRSDPDGLRTLLDDFNRLGRILDDFNRLGRRIETKEDENARVDKR